MRKLALFKEKFSWQPRFHSVEEVDKWVEHLKSITEIDQKGHIFLKRNLRQREINFISNERALCALDCGYYLTRYYWISADNKLMHFAFRSGQKVFYRILQELDADNLSKELQCLKARQQGISTLVEGIISWMVLFVPGVKAAIASADGQKTQIMMGMLTLAIDMLPWWLPPTQTQDKRSSDRALLAFANIGSLVMVQPGSMRGGIAQGTTPTAIHLSEVCDFTDHQTQIEEGLLKAVHSSPEIFMVFESTGNGNTGWWADQWRNNKDYYWQGKARLLPLFLPWFMTPELYPTPTWIQKFPVPMGWKPTLDTKAHAAKCQTYVASTEMLRRVLGKNWTLPLEQQWFWEFNFQDAKRRRMEKSWLRQMPADDYEALQGHNDMVYGDEGIVQIDSQVATPAEVQLYAVAGEGVEKRHEPDVGLIWYGEDSPARPKCEWTTPKGEKLEWMFVPLSRYGLDKPGFDPLKKFLIYEEPQADQDYSIGVDSGTGVGGDRSVICVTRTGYDANPDVQVAEFAADDISNTELYAWVAAATAWYAKYMTERPHPKLIIEQRRKYGDTCQHQLRLMGMRRMHEFVFYDKRRFKEHSNSASARIGWFTNGWSRPMLLGAFKDAIENGWFVIKSPYLATELKEQEQVVMASGMTRMDHASGKHDDRIFAAAMSYFTLHHKDVLAERSKKRWNSVANEPMIIDTRPYAVEIEMGKGKLWG